MNRKLFSIGLIWLVTSVFIPNSIHAQNQDPPEAISIPDPNLAAAVQREIGNITTHSILNLRKLDAPNSGIKDLTGLEHAHNLIGLYLHSNAISDISPLTELTQLEYLYLHDNAISDISPLTRLTQLIWLHLSNNTISDVSPLANMTKLTWLVLDENFISDISPLADMTKLTSLHLSTNAISDISPLADMAQLTSLGLDRNNISDISPLTNMTKLTSLGLSINAISDVSFLADMTQLTSLSLDSNNISNISPLTNMTKLIKLDLDNNAISYISPLSRLTHLEYLDLRNNNISDIAPLVTLNLTGTQWDNTGLDLKGNPLNNEAIQTHIPAMQTKGIEVKYDQRLPRPLVHLVYFRASDTAPRPGVDAEIDALVKKAQLFFADEMERHGYGRKTFRIKSDAQGNTIVHHVVGKFPYAHYLEKENRRSWHEETREQINLPKQYIIVYMIDTFEKRPFDVAGTGGGGLYGGIANIYGWGWQVIAHELGHACGLFHDFRSGSEIYLMSYGHGKRHQLSECAAGWLNAYRAFNPSQIDRDLSTIREMMPPTLDAPPNAIRLRFRVTSRYGIHQARLISPTLNLVDCRTLNGSKDAIVEFVTTDLTPEDNSISLTVIDVHGTWSGKWFSIDVTSLLPPAETISIPDINLAAAVQEEIGSITTHSILNLWKLDAPNSGITDLTGLEYALNLNRLTLDSNNISDISALSELKNLDSLNLRNNPLSYVSINTHIPAIQANGIARGIAVRYDNVAHPALYSVSGNNQEDFAGSILSTPFVVEAQDAKGKPMKNVSITFTVETGSGQLTSPTTRTDAQGKAQTYLMLGWTPGRNTVRATGKGIESWAIFSATGIEPETQIAEDVNRDGVVDVEDLVLVAATIGTTPPDTTIPNTDVNGDGIVNADDLALVMAALATEPTAPAAILTAANLQRWIDEAKQLENKTEIFQRGIAMLEQLLATLLPKQTALLANYPNPSNPETWIPYRLAQSVEVAIHIYAVDGTLVRTLTLGQQPAGIYEARHRAVYWDGKNAQGEHIASGIYFYTLIAGDFNATRKMLIRK